MTALPGHLNHLHENLELTFQEIKEVLGLASEGKLESVTEKFDGINLVFSYDPLTGLRVARSGNDILNFGMGARELTAKFADKGNVQAAFDEGFKMLEKAIQIIPVPDRLKIFGPKTNRWFSIEIVYSAMVNIINYDSNSLVFHESPVFELNHGMIERSNNNSASQTLNYYVNQMQSALKLRNWQITGPAIVRMKALSDGSLLRGTLQTINNAMAIAGINDTNTIRDYIHGMVVNELSQFSLDQRIVSAIADRVAKRKNSLNLMKLKKMVGLDQRDTIDSFVKREVELKKKWIRPIESAIQMFSIEILRNMQSTLISNPTAETMRLKDRLTKAIEAIRNSGNEKAIETLNVQLSKLGDIENVAMPIEGIVFNFKNQMYKFTGAFASINQILSLFTYGPLVGTSLDVDIEREV